MSDLNATSNRFVWVDIPVADLDRAQKFYAAVMAIPVAKERFGDEVFCVFNHQDGNGGCLIVKPQDVSDKGPLVYLNVNSRIREAARLESHGGKVLSPIHSIGPYGFKAVVTDSEGNRIALHSPVDS